MSKQKTKLGLSENKIKIARQLADKITSKVQVYINTHTTLTIERATLRLLGADGVDKNGVPVPNIIVDSLRDKVPSGIAKYYLNALIKTGKNPEELNNEIANGLNISNIELTDENRIKTKAEELIIKLDKKLNENVSHRNKKIKEFKNNEKNPWIYVIVATGNIYEDVKQAKAAAMEGADIIAVIRTTAQSLLDYVPYGLLQKVLGEHTPHRKISE